MSRLCGAGWFAVQTIAGKEDFAILHLGRQGFEAFCPKLPKANRRRGGSASGVKPLFKGYCFAKFDPDRDQWRSINGTLGVSKLVMFGDRPARLPEGIVERLVDLSGTNGSVVFDDALAPGDRVAIHGGPFDEWIGDVLRTRDSDRVIILLDMMSQKLPVTVSRSQLRPLAGAA